MTKRFLPLLIVALVVGVYSPGLSGPFVFDDYYNFVDNPGVKIDALSYQEFRDAIAASTSGPLKRPIPVLSLSLNYYFFGLDTLSYKLFNLIVHLLNGLLVYWVFVQIAMIARMRALGDFVVGSREKYLIAAVVAVWLLHPMNLTSVLYVVQRMNSMATLFMLISLGFYLKARIRSVDNAGWPWLFLSAIAGLAAIFCKENAAVLFFVVLAFELAIGRFSGLSDRPDTMMRILNWVFLVVCGATLLMLMFSLGKWQAAFDSRPYTMGERLLTQGRALTFYIAQIILPNSTKLALFHDEIKASKSILEPVTTLGAWLFLLAVTLFAVVIRKKRSLIAAGWFWYLAGHLIESTIFPLELVHEHRNYFPMLGLMLMLYGLLLICIEKVDYRKVMVIFVVYGLLLGSVTYGRAHDWSSWDRLVLSEAAKNPESARSNFEAARYYFGLLQVGAARDADQAYQKSAQHFVAVTRTDPNSWYGFTGLIRLDDLVGRATPPDIWERFYKRLSSGSVQHMDVNQFLDTMDCQIEGKCTIDVNHLLAAVDAALSNPDLTPKRKRFLANSAAAVSLKHRQLDRAQAYALKVIGYNESLEQSHKNAVEIARARGDRALESRLIEQYRAQVGDEMPDWAIPGNDQENPAPSNPPAQP